MLSSARLRTLFIFLIIIFFGLVGRLQYIRFTKGEIFSLFQVKSFVADKTCKAIESNFKLGFNDQLLQKGDQLNTVSVKGLVVGGKKDGQGNNVLVIKIPGFFYPKYFNLDAGDASWHIFTEESTDLTAETLLPQLKKDCPVVAGVILYDKETINCQKSQKEQKPCEYLLKMTGRRTDNSLINTLFFGKGNLIQQRLSQVKYFFKQVLNIGPIVTISFS